MGKTIKRATIVRDVSSMEFRFNKYQKTVKGIPGEALNMFLPAMAWFKGLGGKLSTWIGRSKDRLQNLWGKKPSGTDVLRAGKDAYWSTTTGLVVATVILIVVTNFAGEKVAGLGPQIRAKARDAAFAEGVEKCVMGPTDYDGAIAPANVSLICNTRNGWQDVSYLSSVDKVGVDGLPEYASLLGVLFDCGFIDSVWDESYLDMLLRDPTHDSRTVAETCHKPFREFRGGGGIAVTVNRTFIPYFIPGCFYLPLKLQGEVLPPEYPGNRSAGFNEWATLGEWAMMKWYYGNLRITGVVIGSFSNDQVPWHMSSERSNFMFRMNATSCGNSSNNLDPSIFYFRFLVDGQKYSTSCINSNANRLPALFAESVHNNPCIEVGLVSSWNDPREEVSIYTCRQGVVTKTDNWDKWMTIYTRVKADFQVKFLGIRGGYDDMYAIYTGVLGALFGAAAAAIPAFLLSVGMTLWHLVRFRPASPEAESLRENLLPILQPQNTSSTDMPLSPADGSDRSQRASGVEPLDVEKLVHDLPRA